MGKLGDLIVRLRLQYEDYKKGLKKATAETHTFGGTLGKMKGVALGVWAAIGAGVTAFARDFVQSTNKIGDKWQQTMGGIKSAWQTVKASLTNWDFENFGAKVADAFKGGKEGVAAADEVYEITNKLSIARAKMQNTLNDLYFTMTDPGKTLEERIAAGKKYLSLQKGLYDEEIALMQRQKDAAVKTWLAGTGVSASTADVEAFFSGYTGRDTDAVSKQFPELRNIYENMRSDATNQPVVDAILGYVNATNRFSEENKRIIRQLNTLTAKDEAELIDTTEVLAGISESIYDEVEDIKDIAITPTDIDLSGLDAAEQKLSEFVKSWEEDQQRIAELNQMLSNSIVSSLAGGMEAFTDMLFGLEGADASAILSALLQPFADSAGQLGGMLLAQGIAVEAFKKSLESLQGGPAIAAGLSLIAISAAMKSGIKALAKGSSGSTTISSGSGGPAGSSMANYESTLTVEVVGKISGNDILLASDRARRQQQR